MTTEINTVPPRHSNQRQSQAKKAVILVRVSSKDQEEGYSLDAQRFRLEDYCKRKNLEVLKVFELTESSTVGDRKKFMTMIDYIKRQDETIALVVDKVDRLQRSFKESPLLDALMQQNSVELHFNTENQIIHKYSNSQQRLFWNLGVMMAQSYIDNMRDNVRRSIEHKLRRGECISAAPIGYLNVKDERGKSTVIVDPERAPLIKKLFEEYATGLYTLQELRDVAKKIGLKNKRGQKTYLETQQIHQVLKRHFYYGVMQIKDQLYTHIYPPIISKTLFERCRDIREGRNQNTSAYASKSFVFRGLLHCYNSGRHVSAETKTRTYKNGNTASWTYLICRKPDDLTKKMWVREDKVLAQVEDVLKRLTIPQDILDDLTPYLKETVRHEREFQGKRVKELRTEYDDLQKRADKLTDLLLDDVITRHDYDSKRLTIQAKQDDLKTIIAQTSKADDDFNEALLSILKLASNAYETFVSADIEGKRRLLSFVFSNLKLNGITLCYSLNIPFDMLIDHTTHQQWQKLIDILRTNHELRNAIVESHVQLKRCLEVLENQKLK
jgi:DNA invertase Pin-like site-specific DNA recombinase